MTITERNNKLKHLITCMKCEVSGKMCDDNCSTQYDVGNMGEIIENLEAISKALEQEPTWIPMVRREPTDEETEDYFEYAGMRIDNTDTILDCLLPDDGQEVLVSLGGNVRKDVFMQDDEGCYFESMDIDEVDAWMPLPKAYKEVEE